jgi:5-formyltetrahydrofolate cyclo-ligase
MSGHRDAEKRALRGRIRAALAAVPPERRTAAGRACAAHLRRMAEYGRAGTVMLFLSLPDEIDTAPLVAAALADGKQVGVPRVVAGSSRRMDVVGLTAPDAPLRRGALGIREPSDGPLIDPAGLDLVVVPGLAFDNTGGRLGQGGGYYDRFLTGPASGAVRCGLGYAFQLVPTVPQHEHDAQMHFVLTEAGVLQVKRR